MDSKTGKRRGSKGGGLIWGKLLFVGGGAALIWWMLGHVEREMRAELTLQTQQVAMAVNTTRVRALSGTKDDLENPDYLRLKEQIVAIRSANRRCRFIYLVGRREDGGVFFMVDSEPDYSPSYSPPGQLYQEGGEMERFVFRTGGHRIEGPTRDAWGVWINSYAPVIDPRSGAVLALLGIDIDVRDWRRDLLERASAPVALALLALLCVASSIIVLAAARRNRQEAEESRRGRDKYQSLMANLPCVTYRCLPDHYWTMLHLDGRILDISGYPAEDFINNTVRTFESVIHPDDSGMASQYIHKAIVNKTHWEVEYRVCHRNGGVRWVRDSGCGVLGEDGKIESMDGFMLDITERRKAKEELIETNRKLEEANARAKEMAKKAEAAAEAKKRFLANMGKELRMPLNGVVAPCRMLMDMELSEEQNELLKLIHGYGEQLLTLINDILDFSDIDAGKLRIKPVPTSPREIVDEIVAPLRQRAVAKGLKFHSRIAGDVPERILADPFRLGQILLCLVGNAVKFTECGEVALTVESPQVGDIDATLRFTVTDTGSGIPEDNLRDLFQPFANGNDDEWRRHGGTGLGLAISKQLVELMGGEIDVESKEQAGTRIWFTITFTHPPAKPEKH